MASGRDGPAAARRHAVPRDVARSLVLQQTGSLKSLLGVGGRAMYLKAFGPSASEVEREVRELRLPSPQVEVELPAVDAALLDAFDRWCDAEPGAVDGAVAPHLFPQWSFPQMAQAMGAAPFPLTAVLNQGAKIVVNARLPRGSKLRCASQLTELEDDGKKYKLTSRVATGPASAPDAVVGYVYGVVPHGNNRKADKAGDKRSKPPRAKPTVPEGAELLCVHSLSGDAGFNYALLSGDFNPIHSVPAAGRASGFKGCILHGFAQLSLVFADVEHRFCVGDSAERLAEIDVRFLSSLHLKDGCEMHVYALRDPADPLKLAVFATDGEDVTMKGEVLLAVPGPKL